MNDSRINGNKVQDKTCIHQRLRAIEDEVVEKEKGTKKPWPSIELSQFKSQPVTQLGEEETEGRRRRRGGG